MTKESEERGWKLGEIEEDTWCGVAGGAWGRDRKRGFVVIRKNLITLAIAPPDQSLEFNACIELFLNQEGIDRAHLDIGSDSRTLVSMESFLSFEHPHLFPAETPVFLQLLLGTSGSGHRVAQH